MALSGRLSEFGVEEALGLIARQEKTGYLEIESRSKRIVLHFDRGKMIQAREPHPDPNDSFLRFVRELRLAGPDDWRAFAEWQRNNPERDPVEGLLAIEIDTRDSFSEWLTLHAQGVVDRVLELSEGTFNFEPTLTPARFAVPLAEKAEFMIMEAGRRVDESRAYLGDMLPPAGVPTILPRRRPTPSDPLQAALLRLIDGQKSIREIMGATTIPTYELTSMLAALVDSEAAVVRVPVQATQVGIAQRGPSVIAKLFVFLTTGLLIAVSVYVGFRMWGDAFTAGP